MAVLCKGEATKRARMHRRANASELLGHDTRASRPVARRLMLPGVSVRHAAVAGSWYAGTARGLAAEVEGFLAYARPPSVDGDLVGLVSPHAGLRYSGPVAAH